MADTEMVSTLEEPADSQATQLPLTHPSFISEMKDEKLVASYTAVKKKPESAFQLFIRIFLYCRWVHPMVTVCSTGVFDLTLIVYVEYFRSKSICCFSRDRHRNVTPNEGVKRVVTEFGGNYNRRRSWRKAVMAQVTTQEFPLEIFHQIVPIFRVAHICSMYRKYHLRIYDRSNFRSYPSYN
jgi:hypothetical protein